VFPWRGGVPFFPPGGTCESEDFWGLICGYDLWDNGEMSLEDGNVIDEHPSKSGLVSGNGVGHEGDMSLEEEKVCQVVVSGKDSGHHGELLPEDGSGGEGYELVSENEERWEEAGW